MIDSKALSTEFWRTMWGLEYLLQASSAQVYCQPQNCMDPSRSWYQKIILPSIEKPQ